MRRPSSCPAAREAAGLCLSANGSLNLEEEAAAAMAAASAASPTPTPTASASFSLPNGGDDSAAGLCGGRGKHLLLHRAAVDAIEAGLGKAIGLQASWSDRLDAAADVIEGGGGGGGGLGQAEAREALRELARELAAAAEAAAEAAESLGGDGDGGVFRPGAPTTSLRDGGDPIRPSSGGFGDLEGGGAPDAGRRLPVIILSHGMGGMRTTYSYIATELASHGYVVVAVEHKDGTACVTVRD